MIGETVTRQRATTRTDRYTNTALDWTTPTELTIDGCAFAPGGTSEDHDGRDAVIQGPTLYAPEGADITAADRVVIRGTAYEVDGEPGVWIDPYSRRTAGVEVPLRVVTG